MINFMTTLPPVLPYKRPLGKALSSPRTLTVPTVISYFRTVSQKSCSDTRLPGILCRLAPAAGSLKGNFAPKLNIVNAFIVCGNYIIREICCQGFLKKY